MSSRAHRFRMLAAAAIIPGIVGCASAPPAPVNEGPTYWSYSRTVETHRSMLTLFDPDDLAHHAHDPDDWYEYDFAYTNDLAAGRFAAVLTGENGVKRVRVTDAPLSDAEIAVAGTSATLRLRVRQDRLLLAGGDAWPSSRSARGVGPHDKRWLSIPNGDYRVTATVLDAGSRRLHDYVFRLEEVDSIDDVGYAPGVPQLRVGDDRPSVAGVHASSTRFVEHCADVPRSAELSPLVARSLPVPGAWDTVEVAESLHQRGLARQQAGDASVMPLVVAREPRVGAFGVFVRPASWLPVQRDRFGRERFELRGRAECAVRITSIDTRGAGFQLGIEPEPVSFGRLPPGLATELVESFDTWLRLSGDPAWRFKGAAVRRAPDSRSLVLGVMQQVGLAPERAEALLRLDNATRARELIEQMRAMAI